MPSTHACRRLQSACIVLSAHACRPLAQRNPRSSLRTCCLQVKHVELVFNAGHAGVRLTVGIGGVSARRELSRYHSHAATVSYNADAQNWLAFSTICRPLHFRRRCCIDLLSSFCHVHWQKRWLLLTIARVSRSAVQLGELAIRRRLLAQQRWTCESRGATSRRSSVAAVSCA